MFNFYVKAVFQLCCNPLQGRLHLFAKIILFIDTRFVELIAHRPRLIFSKLVKTIHIAKNHHDKNNKKFGKVLLIPIVSFIHKIKKIKKMGNLLYVVAVILVIIWAIGFLGYHAGGLIHILLVIAIIAFLLKVIRRA